MKILVLNSGSSSIKYQLFDSSDWRVLASGTISRIAEAEGAIARRWIDVDGNTQRCEDRLFVASHRDGIERIIAGLTDSGVLRNVSELTAIGHRVVHGGESFHCPTVVTDAVVKAIEDMIPLAPLHNPANLDGIKVARALFPSVPSVAVFDTAFHQTMPASAYRYAIPEYLYTEHRVRRYGFHGTSHHFVAERAAVFLGKPLAQCNLITLHLGNGASATAIRGGNSVDTSMGMTPLEGLVMGTRCGDLDPAIHFYLCENLGLDNETLDNLLNRQSGLLGICGVNDLREIHRKAEEGNDKAELALEIMVHRLRKYLGAYYAILGRVDAVVFTGGVGENDADTRARVCRELENLGIELDEQRNLSSETGERAISAATSAVKLLVIPTNEELEIAQQALAAIT